MKLGKSTKTIASLIVCGLLLTACSGDSGNKADGKNKPDVVVEKEGFPIVKEPLKMKMMGPGVGESEWKEMALFKDYAKKTNIDWDFTTPPTSDFGTKLNLALASGDLPDVLFGTDSNTLKPSMEIDYGQQGVLLPLEEHLEEYMPNFSKLMEEDPTIRKSITAPDGHIYSLPMVFRGDTAIWPRGPLWYRGEWLDALNVKDLPTTTDEFYDLLVRFRDEDPNGNGKKDEIPLIDVKMESTRPWMMAAFGMKAFDIEERDGEVRYAPASDDYKEYLTFMNKLYLEKILDPEVFSQSPEQQKAKGQSNQVGLFPDWFSYFTTGQSETEAMNNPMFQPLTNEPSRKTVVPVSPRLSRATLAITKDAPSVPAILRWADYFYSEEGAFYLNKGPEGALWEWAENDNGEKVRVFTKDIDLEKTEDARAKITPNYGIPVPTIDLPASKETTIYNNVKDSVKVEGEDEPVPFSEFIKTETEAKIAPFGEVPYPQLYLTNEENESIRSTATDLKTYSEEMEAKFITGVEPLDNWDKYIKTLKSMGLEDYVKTYQQAYDRWAEK